MNERQNEQRPRERSFRPRGGRGGRGRGGVGAVRRAGNNRFQRTRGGAGQPYHALDRLQPDNNRQDPALDDDSEALWQHDLYEEEEEAEDVMVEEVEAPIASSRRPRGLSSSLASRLGNRSGVDNGGKLRIDNLEYSVTDEDLRHLFEVLGPLKKASIHYDRSGRSEGFGEVIFVKRADAIRAQKKYNGVALDGKQMKIELVGEDNNNNGSGDVFSRLGGRSSAPSRVGGIVVTTHSTRPLRGGRVLTRNTFRSSYRRTGNTTEDLDRELDDYNNRMGN